MSPDFGNTVVVVMDLKLSHLDRVAKRYYHTTNGHVKCWLLRKLCAFLGSILLIFWDFCNFCVILIIYQIGRPYFFWTIYTLFSGKFILAATLVV